MNAASRRGRVLGGAEVLGYPCDLRPEGFLRGRFLRWHRKIERIRGNAPHAEMPAFLLGADFCRQRRQTARRLRRRKEDSRRCKNPDQELKQIPFSCLINSADPSTYRLGKSVRTTRATALPPSISALSLGYSHPKLNPRHLRCGRSIHDV